MAYCEKRVIFALEMELERHIEILLLDNDCVIVPGLGGFIAYHTDARYDAENALFLPPTRIAGFNPKLSMNDNLLAQSYVETYDISYPEAVKRISAEADELKSELERNGYYEITCVGTLRVNNEGGYDFNPFEAGLLTPDLYGLGCFEVSDLSEKDAEKTVTDDAAAENDDKGRFVKIKVSTIRNFAAAAVAIFAFFLLSSPLGNTEKNMASVASIQNSVFYKMLPQQCDEDRPETGGSETAAVKKQKDIKLAGQKAADAEPAEVAETAAAEKVQPAAEKAQPAAAEKAQPAAEKKAEAEKPAAKPEPAKAETEKAVENKADYYCIVLASALSKNNAKNFVQKLTSEGNKDIAAIDCPNGMKVVCGRFATEKEARRQLDSMRGDGKFKDAWVYKVRAGR